MKNVGVNHGYHHSHRQYALQLTYAATTAAGLVNLVQGNGNRHGSEIQRGFLQRLGGGYNRRDGLF